MEEDEREKLGREEQENLWVTCEEEEEGEAERLFDKREAGVWMRSSELVMQQTTAYTKITLKYHLQKKTTIIIIIIIIAIINIIITILLGARCC